MDTWRGMWIHVCGVGGKRPCAISTDILEFRLIGVHARIGTVRSSRSTLISYSRQPSLRGCIANQVQINDLPRETLQQNPLQVMPRTHLTKRCSYLRTFFNASTRVRVNVTSRPSCHEMA